MEVQGLLPASEHSLSERALVLAAARVPLSDLRCFEMNEPFHHVLTLAG